MQTKAEAPEKEPLSVGDRSVALSGVSRRYAAKRRTVNALEGIDLELREREVVAVVGPPAAASPRCSSWWPGSRSRTPAW